MVAGLCDLVMVMYGGRAMETGSAQDIFHHASHPYTCGLLHAVPRMDQEREHLLAIPGAPPNMASPPDGCPFHPRCALVGSQCSSIRPDLIGDARLTGMQRACHKDSAEVQAHFAVASNV